MDLGGHSVSVLHQFCMSWSAYVIAGKVRSDPGQTFINLESTNGENTLMQSQAHEPITK